MQAVRACDVLVVGGGPAGSTAAALLAARGRDVVLLEKEAHPRFHIGESLLPRNLAILDRLGVADAVREIGVHKPGAEFVSDATGESVAFPFSLAIGDGPTHSYQVRRADFDKILFDRALANGADGRERTRLVELAAGADGRQLATAQGPDGPVRFAPRYVLDASGRDTFLAGRAGTKSSDKRNNTAAVYAHYEGVAPRPGADGFITIHLAEDGWFWVIPLPDGVASVGFVGTRAAFAESNRAAFGEGTRAAFGEGTRAASGRGSSRAEAILQGRIAASPTLRARMEGSRRVSPAVATGNYSYKAARAWSGESCMIGDAFAFVDPMFSSGVLMAMTGGELGAEAADLWLDNPRRGTARARRNERRLRGAIARISWLIYRINTPEMRALFMAPSNRLRMRDGMVSLLAGNLDRDPKAMLPVLAFKGVYYGFRLVNRVRGWRGARSVIAPGKDRPLRDSVRKT